MLFHDGLMNQNVHDSIKENVYLKVKEDLQYVSTLRSKPLDAPNAKFQPKQIAHTQAIALKNERCKVSKSDVFREIK